MERLLVKILLGTFVLFGGLVLVTAIAPSMVAPILDMERERAFVGNVAAVHMDTQAFILESEYGEIRISLKEKPHIVDVYGLPADMSIIVPGSRVAGEGEMKDATTLHARAVHILDTPEQSVLTEYDNNETVTLAQRSRFNVVLPADRYQSDQLVCVPHGIVERVISAPKTGDALFAFQFETIGLGSCTLSTGAFSVRISVPDPRAVAVEPRGVLKGEVTIGSSCSPEHSEVKCNIQQNSRIERVVEVKSENGRVATTSVSAEGLYRFELAPGAYVLDVLTIDAETKNTPQEVNVRANGTTRVNIDISARVQ